MWKISRSVYFNRKLQSNPNKRHATVDRIIDIADLEECSEMEKNIIRRIVDAYVGMFEHDGEPLPGTYLVQHETGLKSN